MAKSMAMTEADWLVSTDPEAMVRSLAGGFGERPSRLFACACCRRLGPLLQDPRVVHALEVAERYVDGKAGPAELDTAQQAALKAQRAQRRKSLLLAYAAVADSTAKWLGGSYLLVTPDHVAEAALTASQPRIDPSKRRAAIAAERAPLAALLREIVGNPFRPVRLPKAWLTRNGGAAVQLARAIYEERAFDRMPALGDVLEEAGCRDPEVLAHCRGPGEHARGCWVIDLILGKQ
jgi:hypothetical protein